MNAKRARSTIARDRQLWKRITLLALAVVGLSSVTMSCSTKRHHRTLSFFFDGVPASGAAVPFGEATVAGAAAKEKWVSPQYIRDEDAVSGPRAIDWPIHEPYRKKQCQTCHPSERSQFIAGKSGPLCVQCHEEFFDRMDIAEYRHGPATVGECSVCHDPHEAKIDHLLVREEPDLCRHCHDTSSQEAAEALRCSDLEGFESGRCTTCHDPHGNNSRYFLREPHGANGSD